MMESLLKKYNMNKDAVFWAIITFLTVAILGSWPIFVDLSKVNDKLPYSSPAAVLATEVGKLLVCVVFVLIEGKRVQIPPFWEFMSFSVPAILYAINNNLGTWTLLYMDPSSFQLFTNLKIAATGLCFRVLMNKPLSKAKWIAIALLTLGSSVNSLGGLGDGKGSGSAPKMYVTLTGIVYVLSYSFISAFAGVYTELVMKRGMDTSIFVQNAILYIFGCIVNLTGFFLGQYRQGGMGAVTLDVFGGFNTWAWVIVGTQVVNGIMISIIMKYKSSLSRLFIMGTGMLTTTVLACVIFGYQLNMYFMVAFVMVSVALWLQNRADSVPAEPVKQAADDSKV